MPKREEQIPPGALLERCIQGVRTGISTILSSLVELRSNPDVVAAEFARLSKIAHTGATKVLLEIDNTAEAAFARSLKARWQKLQVLGEESVVAFSGWREGDVCVLADMIDGTDFVEMRLDLWCSAVVLYDKAKPAILGTIVGFPSGDLFYAQCDKAGAWIRSSDDGDTEVFGRSAVTSLRDARVAFYGQKPKNLLALLETGFFDHLRDLEAGQSGKFRIYNFAGNPMMAKLVDRPKLDSGADFIGDIDAVFDVSGQQLHDVVPGAYIALKAGAYMCDLDGTPITIDDLARRLQDPRERIKYVLAATEELAQELVTALRPS